MTLIVANNVNNQITIVSDMALSEPNLQGDTRARELTRIKETLKAIIVTSNICICFADIADYAIAAIRKVKAQFSHLELDDILSILANEQSKYRIESQPDFIVAHLGEQISTLYSIKHEKIEEQITCWIGSKNAFESYQGFFHEAKQSAEARYPNSELNIRSAMYEGISKTIENISDRTVGGIYVPVISTKKGFEYATHMGMYGAVRNQVITDEPTAIQFAGIADGGFGYTLLCPTTVGIAAVGIHIFQISLGIFHHPLLLDYPIALRGSYHQFVEFIREQYGITLAGGIIG